MLDGMSFSMYSSLPSEEPNKSEEGGSPVHLPADPNPGASRHCYTARCWKLVSLAVLSISLCILLLALLLRVPPRSPENWNCGTSNTTAEAKALGCEFDILSYSWTPQPCLDKDTATEFHEWLQEPDRKMGPFPFFYDRQGRDRLQNEEELSLAFGKTLHTTQEEHLGHCTFMMRRIHRVAESNGRLRLNSRYGKLGHTKHCSNEVLKSLQRADLSYLDGARSRFGVSFESC